MPAPKMPRLSVPVDDILDLIEQHDAWGGAMPPAEGELWRQKYKDLKRRAQALYDQQPVENEASVLS
jgi:hypothetical protein